MAGSLSRTACQEADRQRFLQFAGVDVPMRCCDGARKTAMSRLHRQKSARVDTESAAAVALGRARAKLRPSAARRNFYAPAVFAFD